MFNISSLTETSRLLHFVNERYLTILTHTYRLRTITTAADDRAMKREVAVVVGSVSYGNPCLHRLRAIYLKYPECLCMQVSEFAAMHDIWCKCFCTNCWSSSYRSFRCLPTTFVHALIVIQPCSCVRCPVHPVIHEKKRLSKKKARFTIPACCRYSDFSCVMKLHLLFVAPCACVRHRCLLPCKHACCPPNINI